MPGIPDKSKPETDPGAEKAAPEAPAESSGKLNPILPDESETKPQKLRLKQILTPLSPHLTAPRPDADERATNKKAFTPSPKAVPIEPEPELTEEELAARESAGGAKAAGPVPEIETSPPTPEELGLEPGQESTGEPGRGQQPDQARKKTAKKKSPATQPKPRSRKLVLALAVPAVLLLAIVFLVNYLFDPLGLKIQPIEELPDLTTLQQPAQTQAEETLYSDSNQLMESLEEETFADYLSRLEESAMLVAAEPEGLFINAVYFREGMIINPRYGLALVSVEEQGKVALLEDGEGNSYRISMR